MRSGTPLIPLVTLIAMNIPRIFSGALITEQVFAWPGMGRLFVDHAKRGDYPGADGLVLTVSVLVIVFNLVADLAYAASIRGSGSRGRRDASASGDRALPASTYAVAGSARADSRPAHAPRLWRIAWRRFRRHRRRCWWRRRGGSRSRIALSRRRSSSRRSCDATRAPRMILQRPSRAASRSAPMRSAATSSPGWSTPAASRLDLGFLAAVVSIVVGTTVGAWPAISAAGLDNALMRVTDACSASRRSSS